MVQLKVNKRAHDDTSHSDLLAECRNSTSNMNSGVLASNFEIIDGDTTRNDPKWRKECTIITSSNLLVDSINHHRASQFATTSKTIIITWKKPLTSRYQSLYTAAPDAMKILHQHHPAETMAIFVLGAPVMITIQGLMITTQFGQPQRVAMQQW